MHFDFSQLFACHPGQPAADPGSESREHRRRSPIPALHSATAGMTKEGVERSSLYQPRSTNPLRVIAGLDPAIHAVPSRPTRGLRDPQVNGMDARIKSEQGGTRMNLGRPLS
ncbi:hypothetical protein J0X15_18770 [Roseibium sp. CAU 1637]|uniref:Uncharacterized protein n=1 Tax=Roseibium limicola TaxID=2816037 RepID=A0A939ES32_9HYPH|nr:hypothetical protein [Roseibium limicola]MBO0347280.1 hypothetical protein [Roseibium limicola]